MKKSGFKIKSGSDFILNIIFALCNCILGFISHSVWFLAVGAYYIILGVMRILVIQFYAKDKKSGRFIMNFSGVMLLVLSVILSVIVYMTVRYDVASPHHEITMITIALYAFIKLSLAIVEFVKSGKKTDFYHRTLSSITFTDAIVSIYSLQRSMLVSFEGLSSGEIMIFNTASGIGMCLIVIFTALNLILRKDNKNG